MSSVTGLHLLSQSMLNVSCQKQTSCSLPADSLGESPMEFLGQPRLSGARTLLGVPGLGYSDVDDDDGEFVIGIRPKSSPLPRRRTSDSDEDYEFEPPASGSRRVSFADAKGLNLVQVKEFDNWDVPKLPDFTDGRGEDTEEYSLSPLTFSLPLSCTELCTRVGEQKVELESIKLLPGTTILKGVIRVLNISFNKAVYVRTTLDAWSSHFDLLAEYIPGSSEDLMDSFSFKLVLVPPFGKDGARIDFCLRYETTVGTFWANNDNKNYVLSCHRRVKEKKEKTQKEGLNKKSCLKIVSQNFSTVENISAMEGVSKREEKVDIVKAKQISDAQSGTSEDGENSLLSESRRNCSRRSRRKAARMARVRDHFTQRNGGASDTEKEESLPEPTESTPEEKHSDVPSYSEGSSKSETPQLVSESLRTSSQPVLDVVRDPSPAHDQASNSDPRKSECINLADPAAVTGGDECATNTPPHYSNDESTPGSTPESTPECQNINKRVFKAVEKGQEQEINRDLTSNVASQSADSDISAVNSENLVSQTNSFTFGTVVAPLYHQVFGRPARESQNLGDWGNPVKATVNVGNGTDNEKVQGDVIETKELKQERLDAAQISPPTEEEGTSLRATSDGILACAETIQDPIENMHSEPRLTNTSEISETVLVNTEAHSQAVNILSTVLLNPQITTESLRLQGEKQEDNLTHDLRSQPTMETAQSRLSEYTCGQIKTSQEETQEAVANSEASIVSQSASECCNAETDQQSSDEGANQTECSSETNEDELVDKAEALSETTGSSDDDKQSDVLHDSGPNHNNDSPPKETEKSCVSCVEEKDITAPQISSEKQEEDNNGEKANEVVNSLQKDPATLSAEIKVIAEVTESVTEAVMLNSHINCGMVAELKDESTIKEEAVIVSEKNHEMEVTFQKQKGLCSKETTDVKNWEMMVEEEEEIILIDDEESDALRSIAEVIKAVEEDLEERLDVAGMKTASENQDTTEKEKLTPLDKMVAEITAAREEDAKVEDLDLLEDKHRIGEEAIGECVAGKEVVEELKNVLATKTEKKIAGEDELAKETDVKNGEKRLEKGEPFAETQEVTIESREEEEEIASAEEMEIDLSNDDEADVEWEAHNVKAREEKPVYSEEILVEEAGESDIVDADSKSMIVENGVDGVVCSEETLDIAQNKVDDSLSDKILLDNVEENRGEGHNGHIPAKIDLSKEEYFHDNDSVAHDQSDAANDERDLACPEGSSWLFTDELESDQTCHDSASAESDSDDEVELYMHCLRAVHTGAQANKDTGFSQGKRPSVSSRGKLLSTPMPSISESLDEDQNLSCLLENHKDFETADFQSMSAPLSLSNGQESTGRKVSRWRETFSCRNISRTLLFVTLLVLFLVVAHHYDFLACFLLYLISVVWLYYQGEKQPVKKNNKSIG